MAHKSPSSQRYQQALARREWAANNAGNYGHWLVVVPGHPTMAKVRWARRTPNLALPPVCRSGKVYTV